ASAQAVADDLRQFLAAVGGGLETTPRQGAGIAVEPFSLEKLKNSDVLLNYAAIDDYPLSAGEPGWGGPLQRNPARRGGQRLGEKVRITCLPENAIAPGMEGELLQHLPQAKLLISVVSPPFLKCDLCRREVERFWQGAEETGGRYINEKSRLFKALKTTI